MRLNQDAVSPDAALITAATQYCKMDEAHSRRYPSAVTTNLLLYETHLNAEWCLIMTWVCQFMLPMAVNAT